MGGEAEDIMARFREEGHSAFVVGFTGRVGKALVKELLISKLYKRVVLIGRREVKFEEDLYNGVEQKVVDFNKIEEHSEIFQGIDVGFCCLGARTVDGEEGFQRIDHDYTINCVKVALEGGCKQIHVVSVAGASSTSRLSYQIRIKGETNNELKEMAIDRLCIYLPGMVLVDRSDQRAWELIAHCCVQYCYCCCLQTLAVPVTTFAKAMIIKSVLPSQDKVQYISNKDMHRILDDSPISI